MNLYRSTLGKEAFLHSIKDTFFISSAYITTHNSLQSHVNEAEQSGGKKALAQQSKHTFRKKYGIDSML